MMTFGSDQQELRRYVRQWLDERAPFDEVRRASETAEGFDRAQWKELGELGWLAMAIPERAGGGGYGFMELAVLGEEMGRSLFPSPFLPTVVMGAHLLTELGDHGDLLASVAAGDRLVAVVLPEPGSPAVSAIRSSGEWALTGSARPVLAGHTADTLLVAATTDSGLHLFELAGDAEGVNRRRLDVMDLTRPLAELSFDQAPARPIEGNGAQISAALDSMQARAVAFLAMEQVGGAQACLGMSVEYAKHRYQFGRAIGSFQAVKHMCAEMLIIVESAKSAAYHLASVIDGDSVEAGLASAFAKSYCSEAYFRCAADTIQIHGGIGFTWEHNAHLYLKRAKSSSLLFGGAADHRHRLADLLGV